jgi:glycosyltransferase involved in cell wall biosynthesis
MNQNKILIAIPAYNEEFTIENVILDCKNVMPNADILVINDGSTDKTKQKLDQLGVGYVDLINNLGVGGAMRAAFQYAKKFNYDYVIQIDGDGQHDPTSIAPILKNKFNSDVLIGSRFISQENYVLEPYRRAAIKFLSVLLEELSGTKIYDPTSGFRISGTRAINVFSEHYPVEYLADTVGSLMLGSKFGLTFEEFPVAMKVRQGGKPSQNLFRSIFHLIRTTISICMIRIRKIKKVGFAP